MTNGVSAVVVQHNLSELSMVAVESLRAQSLPPYEILVVDNGSERLHKAWLFRDIRPDLVPLFLTTNRGYVVGTNEGWRKARGEYVLLCNNDIALARSCVARLVAAMEAQPRLGWLSACYQAGPWQSCTVEFPAEVEAELAASEGRERKHFDAWADALGSVPEVVEANVTEATVVLVRAEAVKRVGYYWDDLVYQHSHDYALRLREAGYTVGICKTALFWHRTDHPTIKALTGTHVFREGWDRSKALMDERWGKDWEGLWG